MLFKRSRERAMRTSLVLGLVAATGLCGCAKNSNQITASYVSPYQYENWTCSQLADEAGRVNSRAAQAAGVQDEKATSDAVATTVAVVIFWPALFFVGGNDQQTAELAQLRGQAQAIEASARYKRCGGGAVEAKEDHAVAQAVFAEARPRTRIREERASRLDATGIATLPYGLPSAD
jgi:hypothetical protein